MAHQSSVFTKSELFDKLKGFNKHHVREIINLTIVEVSAISMDMAKRKKRLTRSEAEAILKKFD